MIRKSHDMKCKCDAPRMERHIQHSVRVFEMWFLLEDWMGARRKMSPMFCIKVMIIFSSLTITSLTEQGS